ncbi:MAG: hypothetical protein OEZ34_12070, partial [Spirochaetia bacterium]|nr:hypothetical protein [Spirochaetia bacterium]
MKYTNKVIRNILILILFTVSLSLQADTITFKNGATLIGKIVAQTRTTITLDSDAGKKVYQKNEIKRISYDNKWEELKKQKQEEAARLQKEKEDKLKKEEEERLKREKAKKDKENELSRKEQERIQKERDKKEAEDVARKAKILQNQLKQKRNYLLSREDAVWAYMHQDYRVGPDKEKNEEAPPVAVIEDSGYSERSRWEIVKRNALLPGWGYHFAGRKNYSYIGAGVFAALLFNTYTTRNTYLATKNTYDEQSMMISAATFSSVGSGNPGAALVASRIMDDGAYSGYEKSAKDYNNSISLLGIVYAGILIHSYFLEPSVGKSKSDKTAYNRPRFSLAILPQGK